MVAPSSTENMSSLPDEIVENILTNLRLPSASTIGRERYEPGAPVNHEVELKRSMRTLSAVARVSKRFNRIATPILYAVYPGQSAASPRRFLRIIRAKPELAGYVEDVVLDPWKIPQQHHGDWQRHFTLTSPRLLRQYIKSTPYHWNDAEAALLLLLCTKVESLAFCVPVGYVAHNGMSGLFDQLFRQVPDAGMSAEEAESRLPLRKVKELQLHHPEQHSFRTLNGLKPLLHLASLQSLSAFRFSRDLTGPIQQWQLHHLRDLTLRRCRFDARGLLATLWTCISLESLSIGLAGCVYVNGQRYTVPQPVDFCDLGDVILRRLPQLRKLRLDDRGIDAIQPRPFPSLKDGPALEELAIGEACLGVYKGGDLQNLPLVDMLPSSLQSLAILRSNCLWDGALYDPENDTFRNQDRSIVYRFGHIHDKVLELLQVVGDHLPELKEIHIDTPLDFGMDVEQFHWKEEKKIADPMLARSKVTVDEVLLRPEQVQLEWAEWIRAKGPSVVLRRMD